MKIGLISDTHGYYDERIAKHLEDSDEIWHAGDVGDYSVLESLAKIAPLQVVYGNIDGQDVRGEWPENLLFKREGMKILMRHIGGYPGSYNRTTLNLIRRERPDIVMVGHSHITKVIRDKHHNHLHINPGAAGKHGFHKMRTLIKMELLKGKISSMQLVELGKRGEL